jgi:hypothetical protein
MNRKRSTFVRAGLLAAALTVSLGLVAGAAEAQKKKKGGKGGTVNVATTSATVLPPTIPAQPPGCIPFPPGPQCTTPASSSLVKVPLTVGKKAKGKVVGPNGVSVTYTLASGTAGSASLLMLMLTAPNGRTIFVANPAFGDSNVTTIGPVTVTPNSPFSPCPPNAVGPVTICETEHADSTVRPPNWTGIFGQPSLATFAGVPARGVWTLRLRNIGLTGSATLVSADVAISTVPASKGAGKKKK